MEIFVLLYALWPFILIISFCIIGWKIGSFIRRKLSGPDSNSTTPKNPTTQSKPIYNCPFCNAICQHPTEGANTCHCNQTFYFHKGEVMPLKDMMTPFEIASVQTLAKIAKADGAFCIIPDRE